MFLSAIALTLAAPACRTYDTALPPPLRGWTRAGRSLDTGHTVTLPRSGGTIRTDVRIRKAGIFGIALDQPGWIDVSRASGRPLVFIQHAHGPKCSTIRKIVRYRLRPGAYRVTITRLKADRARMMLVAY